MAKLTSTTQFDLKRKRKGGGIAGFGCWISRDADQINKVSSGWRDADERVR